MKKSRILAAAMASIVLTGALASCGKDEEVFESENNANFCVYGPPPVVGEEEGNNSADGQECVVSSPADGEKSATSQGD